MKSLLLLFDEIKVNRNFLEEEEIQIRTTKTTVFRWV